MNVPDPLPVVDGLLAATARVPGLTLATSNVADVEGTGVELLIRSLARNYIQSRDPSTIRGSRRC